MAEKTVLVVDDTATFRLMARTIAAKVGCAVIGEATNGQEAVELYTAHKPDLVLMDIEMPVMNGIKALKNILADDPGATVVMMTTVDRADVIDDCLMAGARDYLRKDLGPQVIEQRVREEVARL